MMNPDLLWYQSSLLSHPTSLLSVDVTMIFLGFLLHRSNLFHDFSHGFFFLSPFLFSICFFFVVVVLVFVDPSSSISVQAAKLQWSLDEKVGSSRGTRVSRPFVYLFVCVCLCWCVVLLSGLTLCSIRITTLAYFTKCQIFHFHGKPLCSLCCPLTWLLLTLT